MQHKDILMWRSHAYIEPESKNNTIVFRAKLPFIEGTVLVEDNNLNKTIDQVAII